MAPQRPKPSEETRHDLSTTSKTAHNFTSTTTGAAANYPGITKHRRAGLNTILKEVTSAPMPGGAVMSVAALGDASGSVGADSGYNGVSTAQSFL